MCIKEDINVVSFYCAAAVLCGIDHAVDHNLASVRNHSRVNREAMAPVLVWRPQPSEQAEHGQ